MVKETPIAEDWKYSIKHITHYIQKMEVMRVTSSSNQEVMQKYLPSGKTLLVGIGSPYMQTEKSNLIVLNYVQWQ